MSARITDDVNHIVTERARQYGHPHDHHWRTANAITQLLRHKLDEDHIITAEDWQRMMIVDKLMRDTHQANRDNRADIIGYAVCMDVCREEDGGYPDPGRLAPTGMAHDEPDA